MRTLRFALLVSFILALGSPLAVRADDIIHIVQPGETLFRIGLRYGVAWRDIAAANGLATTRIYAGQQLRIPIGGSVASGENAASGGNSAPAVSPAPAASGTYTVVRGDTLGGIAARFGVMPGALAAANQITNPNRIYYGQVLVIPTGGSVASGVAAPATEGSASGSRLVLVDISEQRMYVYENGNLLWAWVTSTGSPGRGTAPGRYSVLNKIPNAYASTWNLQMPYWLGIYWVGRLQNGIHALPILANGEKLWAGWLGTPVSYGCVILGDAEAQTLYNWVEVDTPVTIQW